jgi:GDSL-like Lipase/Acylhydrolase family
MGRIRSIAINCAVVLASLMLSLLLAEGLAFRFIFLPSDVPTNAFVNGLIRYEPDQSGVWRVRNEVAARYAINRQGWNSGVGDYIKTREPGMRRVAVVGDSMVEALQVPHDRSLAERLSGEFSRSGRAVQVYRFGIGGAPMSQYVNMIEREILDYRPDVIVVLLIHNDFDESFQFVQGRYTSSFLKLRIADGKVLEEIPPIAWQPALADWIRRTATARYMYYRWQVRPDNIRAIFLPSAHANTGRYEANIDLTSALGRMPNIVVATDHIFGRMSALARQSGTRLVVAIDGVRSAIYSGGSSDALVLNSLSADLAARHGITFVDLHPAFQADWAANGKRFEFDADHHWNEHGHAVAAAAIARVLETGQPLN